MTDEKTPPTQSQPPQAINRDNRHTPQADAREAPDLRAAGWRRQFQHLGAPGLAFLSIVLYLLVADAAIETFVSRSPVGWWVVILAVAYLAGSAALWWRGHPLWQHLDWKTRATTSLFVLLGLLAFTVWLPGGLTQGVVLLRQPTSTVLAVVSALALLLSGTTLVQMYFVPVMGRRVIGLLAAYGIASFLYGAAMGTPYPALFHGHSLWSRLPFWLQGAFIGALVLLPAAVVFQIAVGLRHISRTELRVWRLQVPALGMSLVIVAAGLYAPGGFAPTQLSSTQIINGLEKSSQDLANAMVGINPPSERSLPQIADRLEKLFTDIESNVRDLPRDTFDIQEVVGKFGPEPTTLFRWVRDETYLVPYRGVLRSYPGVLMDRLGNSLDRALLLHELLRTAGHDARLAHGTLSKEQAMQVLRRARPVPQAGVFAARRPSPRAVTDFVDKYARQNQLDRAKFQNLAEKSIMEAQRVSEVVLQRVEEQARAVASTVGRPQAGNLATVGVPELDALRDHWWVQWQEGSTWVDLDPTLPDAEPGRTLTGAQETIAANQLDSTLYHTVRIRIIVERWDEGGLEELPTLDYTLRPSELQGVHIGFAQYPLNWPRDLGLFKERDRLQRLKTTLLAQHEWLPILSVGPDRIVQSGFTDSGDIDQTPLAPLLGGSSEKLGRNIGDILSSGKIGQTPGRKPEQHAHLTAEWIEYEIRSPGYPVGKIRREVFDLVGPAARATGKVTGLQITDARRLDRALALLGETDILPLASNLSPEFVSYLFGSNRLANREILLGLLRNGDSATLEAVTADLGKLKPLPVPLYSLALARRAWSRSRGDIYLDRPNIFAYHRSHVRQDQTGKLQAWQGFDIVSNDIAVLPRPGIDAYVTRLEQGVLDTNVEALIMASSGMVQNVAEIFAKAGSQGIAWVSIRNVRDPAWHGVELPKDVRARIEGDLASGHVVVVPKKAILLEGKPITGWWRVDPVTGQTLGIGENGAGQTATEQALAVGVLTGAVAGGICIIIAGSDKDCLTPRDAFICAGVALGAGLALAGSVYAALAAPAVLASGVASDAWGIVFVNQLNNFRLFAVIATGFFGGAGLHKGGPFLGCLGSGASTPPPTPPPPPPTPKPPTPTPKPPTPTPKPPTPSGESPSKR